MPKYDVEFVLKYKVKGVEARKKELAPGIAEPLMSVNPKHYHSDSFVRTTRNRDGETNILQIEEKVEAEEKSEDIIEDKEE